MPQIRGFSEKLLVCPQLRMHKSMKNHLKVLPLLVVMTISTFTLAGNLFFFNASATYIEGFITQDTVWTLTDSPFVVSKNITVCPNATLTIEPGVEARFGGDFSLIVEGILSARGEGNNTITFTSNKDQPEAADWNTIQFNGTALSILAYCVVKYAKNGITIENGNVKIENCQIGNNLENGMTIENSIVEVQNNEIANNSQSGIYITGDNQVTIQSNTIRSNNQGILLTGNLTIGVDITDNIIMSNNQSGVQLDADDYRNTVIRNNILSANNHGFYVSGQANTYITKNSISYNTIGIFYDKGNDHVAHYNDIYGNEYGMDISSNTTANAEYNYWGHESGPYHGSLNPAGKGNPVGGNGVSLDFIFFLTAPIGYLNERPTARLLTNKKVVPPNQIITFIATTSSDDRQVDQYFFDFGDGKTSGWTTLSIFVHQYSSKGTYNATLKVMDDFGVTSNNIATVRITCEALIPVDTSITPSSFEVGSGGQVSITVHATSGTSPVENANIALLSIIGGSFTSSSGLTDSTGHFTTTFLAPNVTQITNVRITATVSKTGYTDGSDHKYLVVHPPLMVQVTATPATIKSEATSNVTVHVTYIEAPVSDAAVFMALDGGGAFSVTDGNTDENGDCTFFFTAPQTTTQINITLTANATKTKYVYGQGQTKITVEPKRLLVQVIANPVSTNSEMTSNIAVKVTHDSNPISGVTVTLSSDNGGSFYPTKGTTDADGECVLTFASQQVTTPINVTIIATATKTGYVDGTNQTTIAVNLGTLNVQATTNPAIAESKATSTVFVHVTYNAKPVPNATVTVSSDRGGSFDQEVGTTDENGDCTFFFTAPQTTTHLEITITATSAKSGYLDGRGQTKIIITPAAPSGLPLAMILVVAAAIVVIAVILVLIKMGIIAISWKEV